MKKLFLFLFCVAVFSACTTNDEDEPIVYQVKNSSISGTYEGQPFELDFFHFKLCENQVLSASDTISLYEEIKTRQTDFAPVKQVEVLSIRNEGPFEVRKCLYNTAFVVYVTSWAHEPHLRYLSFNFEAEEVWLGGDRIASQPFVFMQTKCERTYFPLEESDENLTSKHLLKFEFAVINPSDSSEVEIFNYDYYVAYNNHSVFDDFVVDPSDIIVTVTYNWQPD